MVVALTLLTGCQRGPQPCIFDGTSIGITPIPIVALHPDGTLDQESRYSWQDFPWPTDPQLLTVEHVSSGWSFRGTTGGQPWAFKGTFPDAGGAFVRLSEEGAPPAMEIVAKEARPVLVRYRVKPCRAFQVSKTGDRSCTSWGHELNARTKLQCQ
jgi:hypothetical protein